MNDKLFKVLDENIYFHQGQESQEYAKNNPGKIIIRNRNLVCENNQIDSSIKMKKINLQE